MNLPRELKRALLRSLLPMNGQPMPQGVLFAAAGLLVRPDRPTQGDFDQALAEIEADGYISGLSSDLAERVWILTEKGILKARQL